MKTLPKFPLHGIFVLSFLIVSNQIYAASLPEYIRVGDIKERPTELSQLENVVQEIRNDYDDFKQHYLEEFKQNLKKRSPKDNEKLSKCLFDQELFETTENDEISKIMQIKMLARKYFNAFKNYERAYMNGQMEFLFLEDLTEHLNKLHLDEEKMAFLQEKAFAENTRNLTQKPEVHEIEKLYKLRSQVNRWIEDQLKTVWLEIHLHSLEELSAEVEEDQWPSVTSFHHFITHFTGPPNFEEVTQIIWDTIDSFRKELKMLLKNIRPLEQHDKVGDITEAFAPIIESSLPDNDKTVEWYEAILNDLKQIAEKKYPIHFKRNVELFDDIKLKINLADKKDPMQLVIFARKMKDDIQTRIKRSMESGKNRVNAYTRIRASVVLNAMNMEMLKLLHNSFDHHSWNEQSKQYHNLALLKKLAEYVRLILEKEFSLQNQVELEESSQHKQVEVPVKKEKRWIPKLPFGKSKSKSNSSSSSSSSQKGPDVQHVSIVESPLMLQQIQKCLDYTEAKDASANANNNFSLYDFVMGHNGKPERLVDHKNCEFEGDLHVRMVLNTLRTLTFYKRLEAYYEKVNKSALAHIKAYEKANAKELIKNFAIIQVQFEEETDGYPKTLIDLIYWKFVDQKISQMKAKSFTKKQFEKELVKKLKAEEKSVKERRKEEEKYLKVLKKDVTADQASEHGHNNVQMWLDSNFASSPVDQTQTDQRNSPNNSKRNSSKNSEHKAPKAEGNAGFQDYYNLLKQNEPWKKPEDVYNSGLLMPYMGKQSDQKLSNPFIDSLHGKIPINYEAKAPPKGIGTGKSPIWDKSGPISPGKQAEIEAKHTIIGQKGFYHQNRKPGTNESSSGHKEKSDLDRKSILDASSLPTRGGISIHSPTKATMKNEVRFDEDWEKFDEEKNNVDKEQDQADSEQSYVELSAADFL